MDVPAEQQGQGQLPSMEYGVSNTHMQQQQPRSSVSEQSAPAQDLEYDTSRGGHYGACAALAARGFAPAELYSGPWTNIHQGLTGQYGDILTTYWQHTINQLETDVHDYKNHQLPLARIKKVMKADPDVKMISAEAPILFAKGCEIFITELTMRAWIHAEENKRRTLQRSDIASALCKSDMFDFLIDIVPREEAVQSKRSVGPTQSTSGMPPGTVETELPTTDMTMSNNGQHIPQPDYPLNNPLATDSEYRQQQTIYPPQAQPHSQPSIYNDIDGMYPPYPPQQERTSPEQGDIVLQQGEQSGPISGV